MGEGGKVGGGVGFIWLFSHKDHGWQLRQAIIYCCNLGNGRVHVWKANESSLSSGWGVCYLESGREFTVFDRFHRGHSGAWIPVLAALVLEAGYVLEAGLTDGPKQPLILTPEVSLESPGHIPVEELDLLGCGRPC